VTDSLEVKEELQGCMEEEVREAWEGKEVSRQTSGSVVALMLLLLPSHLQRPCDIPCRKFAQVHSQECSHSQHVNWHNSNN
jgi:hypothetical protein